MTSNAVETNEKIKFGGMRLVWHDPEITTWGEKYTLHFNEPPEGTPEVGSWGDRNRGVGAAIANGEARISIGPEMLAWIFSEKPGIEMDEFLEIIIIAIRDGVEVHGEVINHYNIAVPELEILANHTVIQREVVPLSDIPVLQEQYVTVPYSDNITNQWLATQIEPLKEKCGIGSLQFGRNENSYPITSG